MTSSIYDKVLQALRQAENHNSNVMVKPEVILWPDPEKQWLDVMGTLKKELPQILVYGNYQPEDGQGPAIWLKCVLASEASGIKPANDAIPIIYLPGVSKSDLRNVENAVFNFQPLLEYQYTGTLFMQENGREWTVLAFVENPVMGMGVRVAKDAATKEALRKALPVVFQDRELFTNRESIDADFLNSRLFPDAKQSLLHWMCRGDEFLNQLDEAKRAAFESICASQYGIALDPSNIKAIAEKLGSQSNNWKEVWFLYTMVPKMFPQIEELLRMAKPSDLGAGIFSLPEESWPQVNDDAEADLLNALKAVAEMAPTEAVKKLQDLESKHARRRKWVWSALGKAPLAGALQHLVHLAEGTGQSYLSGSIADIQAYYISSGYRIDQSMRKALAAVRTERDKSVIKSIIRLIYQPWLEALTDKFQKRVQYDASIFTTQQAQEETESFVLFVDAFRYELAKSYIERSESQPWKCHLESDWSAIPSLTPTAKPQVSPVAPAVSAQSNFNEFRPQTQSGKDLATQVFRDELKARSFTHYTHGTPIQTGEKYWQEIGDIDTKGHNEQANMVRFVDELFGQIDEAIYTAFEQGIQRIKIVTDHGWLLMPGGLPKEQLHNGLAETRWGRCAMLKEGVNTELMHLPWRWNPAVFIAYAPGISCFKANVEYTHGGISIHECLVPKLIIENLQTTKEDARINAVKWVNLRCTITTSDVSDGYRIDIRSRYNDPESSIIISGNTAVKENKASVAVNDSAEYQAATIVLLDPQNRIIYREPTTVGE